MAILWNSVSNTAAPAKQAGFVDRLTRLVQWFSARHARAETLRELARMDERDLRDLRISPYDFSEIANGTYRR
jgi:uncharacterized protein YjiS (DUF1127 family)